MKKKKKADKKEKVAESGDTKKGKPDEEELDPKKYFENRKAWLEKKMKEVKIHFLTNLK